MKHFSLTFFLFLFSVSLLTAQIPRPEHPKPQFKRAEWKNLNGQWDFAFDFGNSGVEREFYRDVSHYDKKITVPFAPESKLSGIGHKGFMPSVWYHRSVNIPSDWDEDRILELSEVLLQNPAIAGFTYTQLYDIDQEVNGIYTFERELKFDKEILRKAYGGSAAIVN